jgi:hypothetical protein
MHGAFHLSGEATQVSARFKTKFPAVIRKEVLQAAQAVDSVFAVKRIPCEVSTEKRLKEYSISSHYFFVFELPLGIPSEYISWRETHQDKCEHSQRVILQLHGNLSLTPAPK